MHTAHFPCFPSVLYCTSTAFCHKNRNHTAEQVNEWWQHEIAVLQDSIQQSQQAHQGFAQSMTDLDLDERLQTLEEGFGSMHAHTDKLDTYINTMLKDMMSLANQGQHPAMSAFQACMFE